LLIRDLLLPPLWIASWVGNDYVWRENRITAMPGQALQISPAIGDVAVTPEREWPA